MKAAEWRDTNLVQVVDYVLSQEEVDDILGQMFRYGSQSGYVISIQIQRLERAIMKQYE